MDSQPGLFFLIFFFKCFIWIFCFLQMFENVLSMFFVDLKLFCVFCDLKILFFDFFLDSLKCSFFLFSHMFQHQKTCLKTWRSESNLHNLGFPHKKGTWWIVNHVCCFGQNCLNYFFERFIFIYVFFYIFHFSLNYWNVWKFCFLGFSFFLVSVPLELFWILCIEDFICFVFYSFKFILSFNVQEEMKCLKWRGRMTDVHNQFFPKKKGSWWTASQVCCHWHLFKNFLSFSFQCFILLNDLNLWKYCFPHFFQFFLRVFEIVLNFLVNCEVIMLALLNCIFEVSLVSIIFSICIFCVDYVSDDADSTIKEYLWRCTPFQMSNEEPLSSQIDSKDLLADYQSLSSDAERIEKELNRIMIRSEEIISKKKKFFSKLDELKKSMEEQVSMESVQIECREFVEELCDYVNLREGFIILVERFSFDLKKVSIGVQMLELKMKSSMSRLLDMEKTAEQQVEVEKIYSDFEECQKELCDFGNVKDAFLIFSERFKSEMDRLLIRIK